MLTAAGVARRAMARKSGPRGSAASGDAVSAARVEVSMRPPRRAPTSTPAASDPAATATSAGSSSWPAKLSSKSWFIRSWRLSRSRRGSHLRTVTGVPSGDEATTNECTSRDESLAQLVQQGEGLKGRQVLQVQAAQVFENGLLDTGEEGQLASPFRGGGRLLAASESGPPLAVELGPLEVAQDFLGPGHDRGGEPGQAGDLDPERAVGAAGLDLAQEYHRIVPLAGGDVKVADAGEVRGEVGELVVVGGEDRLAARHRVARDLLGDRPGDRKAVEGGGPAADLVEE